MKLLYPTPLKRGDRIGFFSPSSPATAYAPQRFARAKRFLENQGFELVAGALTGYSDYYRSGCISDRVAELNELIRDPSVRCIISTIGGQNSNALLPYLDYDALIREPKIIIGYSDVTALLLGIHARTGLVTFYGPALVASLGELSPLVDETFASFFELLSQHPFLPYCYRQPPYWSDEWLDWESQDRPKQTFSNAWNFMGQGCVRGRLIGGNLNTMYGIWGSDYMPKICAGDILVLEDSLKDIACVERAFAWLKLNGVFDTVAAVILGKHEKFNDLGTGRRPIDVLLEVLADQVLPIVDGFDCCHTHPMLTLPLGVIGEIDFNHQQIRLIEPWLAR